MLYSLLHFELFKQFSVLSQNILWSVDHRQGAWEAVLMIVIKMTPNAMMVMVLLCSSPSQHLTRPPARFSSENIILLARNKMVRTLLVWIRWEKYVTERK